MRVGHTTRLLSVYFVIACIKPSSGTEQLLSAFIMAATD